MSELTAPDHPLSRAHQLGLGPGVLLAEQRRDGGAASSESRFGWLGSWLKRGVGRLLRFHVLRQAEFNAGAVRALREAEAQIRALAGALAEAQARIEAQQSDSARRSAETAALLEAQQHALEERVAGLDPGAAERGALEERLRGLAHSVEELEAELAGRSKRLEAKAEEWRRALERQAVELEEASERDRSLALGLAELQETAAVGMRAAGRAEELDLGQRSLREELEGRLEALGSSGEDLARRLEALGSSDEDLARRLEVMRLAGVELERRLEEQRAAGLGLEGRVAGSVAALDRLEGELERRMETPEGQARGTELSALGEQVAQGSAALEAQAARLDRNEAALRSTEPRLEGLEQDARALAESLPALANELRGRIGTLAERVDPTLPLDYLAFEHAFRGEEATIRERMRQYAQLFRPGRRVLDVGCGRGEFIEVCREQGVDAYGVDADADMVSCCTGKQLEVVQDHALHHLEGLRDRTLDGVFSAQFVEHLPPAELLRFLALAAAKLRRGGILVLETINPDTFTALRTFYADPTHRQPLPSRTLRFLVEAAGFRVQQVLFSSPIPDEAKLALLPEPAAAKGGARGERSALRLVRGLNANSRLLNDLLFGPQDYAIVAQR